MNKSEQPTPTNYTEALALLTKLGNSYIPLKIANNTYLEKLPFNVIDGDTIRVRLHATAIVTFTSDNTTILNSGGFRTQTTKERLNRYLPAGCKIMQLDGHWFYSDAESYSEAPRFLDTMEIDSTTGKVIS